MQYFGLEKLRHHPVPGQRNHSTNVVRIKRIDVEQAEKPSQSKHFCPCAHHTATICSNKVQQKLLKESSGYGLTMDGAMFLFVLPIVASLETDTNFSKRNCGNSNLGFLCLPFAFCFSFCHACGNSLRDVICSRVFLLAMHQSALAGVMTVAT